MNTVQAATAISEPVEPARRPRARLSARILAAAGVRGELLDTMYALYATYYECCDHARFVADLARKDYVILLEDEGALRGFSTVAHFDFRGSSGPVKVLFSGDTIIHRSAWGEQALSHSFARLAGALRAAEPAAPLYWLLISKGHRTYRYLGVFARDFHPHPRYEDPQLAGLAAEIASARFGADFDARTGVVAFAQSQGQLRDEVADVPAHLAARPEVAFFLRRNPGFRQGHELVCLTELRSDNLRGGVRDAFLVGLEHGLG